MSRYAPSKLALAYHRRRATEKMLVTVRIERILEGGGYDRKTKTVQASAREIIYEGAATIRVLVTGGTVQVGSEEFAMQSTQLSIPWGSDALPRKDDVGEVLDHPDAGQVGRRFEIQSVPMGGDMRESRTMSINFVESKGQHDE